MRHKILNLIHDFIESTKLSETDDLDEKYLKINLKGTKKENMLRYSKKHSSSGMVGLNKHLIYVATGIDSNDNRIMQISGLGKVSTNMLETLFSGKLDKVDIIITDGDTAYRKICEEKNISLILISAKKHNDEFENSLGDINSVHSQLEIWLQKFRGVSCRHLQKYLDWFIYVFMLFKKFTSSNLEIKMCESFITHKDFIKTTDISHREFPIDLYDAYGEYKYGIFEN